MRDTIVKIYPQMMAMAKAYLHYYGRTDLEPEDVVQDAILNVLSRNTEVDDKDRYLFACCINVIRNHVRDVGKRENIESEYCYVNNPNIREEWNLDPQAALEALAYMDRVVLGIIVDNVICGIPYAELARVFGVPMGTILSWVSRAKAEVEAIYSDAKARHAA